MKICETLRSPVKDEPSSDIRTIFTLGLVFAETIVIYALVIAMLLLFHS